MTELRYRIGDAGAFLALRQTARNISARRGETPLTGSAAVLDFAGVQAITGAFADELVAGVTAAHPGHRLHIEGATADVRDILATALERRGLDATWAQTGGDA